VSTVDLVDNGTIDGIGELSLAVGWHRFVSRRKYNCGRDIHGVDPVACVVGRHDVSCLEHDSEIVLTCLNTSPVAQRSGVVFRDENAFGYSSVH
jgi:hypothetical protein